MQLNLRLSPIRLAALLTLVGSMPFHSLTAQGTKRRLSVEAEFLKEPNGTPLVHLNRGSEVTAGSVKGTWQEVTVEGWIVGNELRDDKRDGFDVAVNIAAGTALRASMGGGTTLGLARAGALFNRIEVKSGWVHVRRSGWVPKSVVESTAPTKSAAAAPDVPAPDKAAAPSTSVSIAPGSTVSSEPDGPPIGTFETAVRAEVQDHRGGWSRVRIDAWVRDGAIGVANGGGPTAADLRENPDKYIGQTVDWTLQVIAVQKADELRPELPLGQPYVLARGPLPETGFVYLLVKPDEGETFKALAPLARVQVRATVRAGKSRFLPTPVLTFVRRLD